MNFFKSINMNSGQAIYNFAWAISAHTALPLGRIFIARPSFLFLGLSRWWRGCGLSPARHAKACGPRKSKFWKMKKTPEDIIILQMCTINDSHMIHGFWDMECSRKILSFSIVFRPFTPPNNPKNQNFEKMKNHLKIFSFHTGVT